MKQVIQIRCKITKNSKVAIGSTLFDIFLKLALK